MRIALAALFVVSVLFVGFPLAGRAQQRGVAGSYTYLEGRRSQTVEVDASGSMWLVVHGRRFETALGTDRVIVVGRDLEGLDVVLDEVLSERAGIVAVRSGRVGEGPLALAVRLSEAVRSGRLEAASPDLALAHIAREVSVPPNDPSLGGQWFYETIDMAAAWTLEDGDPAVTIAIVDNGCDLSHPDLAAHMLPGYDAVDDDDDPSFVPGASGNEHGTACAGVAAAVTDNGIDVAGTCPECSLRCIRLLGEPGALIPISSDVRAFDFALAHDDIAVVSNSWGLPVGMAAPFAIVHAIATVITEGHGGRGALVVFAAGNDGWAIGADELQAIPGALTVGAINPLEGAIPMSNSGRSIALVAPMGTLTTDLSGPDGADPGDVTGSFGGTSAACPIVAGVAGLLASARPDLSGAELRATLSGSVRRAPFAVPDAIGHDPVYGFGIVDPGSALRAVLPRADAGPMMPDASTHDAGGLLAAGSGCSCRVARASPGAPSGVLVLAVPLLGVLAVSFRSRRRRARPIEE